jgi:hypothetical protein
MASDNGKYESEGGLIGRMIRFSDKERIEKIISKLNLEHFHSPSRGHPALFRSPRNQDLFRAIIDLHKQGLPPDIALVINRIEELKKTKDIPYDYIAEITKLDNVPTIAHVEEIAEGIISNWGERVLQGLLKDAGQRNGPIASRCRTIANELLTLTCELTSEPGPASVAGILLSDVVAEKVEWLWQDRIPLGKLTILDGDPGLGKSVLTMDLAGRVSAGLGMPDGSDCKPGGVVILNAEDGLADTIKPRLAAAAGDANRVLALNEIPGPDGPRAITLPSDLAYVEAAIKRMDAKLVTVDPVMAFLGQEVNVYRDQDCRRALHPLKDLAERTGAAVLVVRHLNKNVAGNPLYRGGGSIGIIGAARSALLLAKDPDNADLRILASTKCNLAKLPTSLSFQLSNGEQGLCVGWVGPSSHTAESLLAAPQSDEERGATDEAVEFLAALLANGPVTAEYAKKEARKAGIAERTLSRAKSILKVESRRVGGFADQGKWTWFLPNQAP